MKHGGESATANTVSTLVFDDIELFQRLIRQYAIHIDGCERGDVDVFHKRSVVFLDKVKQVAKRLGGGLKQGELFACFVGFGTKKGFNQLNNILLFHAIDRLGIVSNTNVVYRIDVYAGICLDRFQKRGFVFGEFDQVIENNDFTRVIY